MKKLTIEETGDISLQLISIAGDSAGLNLLALKKAAQDKFADAQQLLKNAHEQLTTIHQVHADLIQKEAQGIEPYINTLFVHAQDYFANALIYNELTKYFVDIYSQLSELKKGSCDVINSDSKK